MDNTKDLFEFYASACREKKEECEAVKSEYFSLTDYENLKRCSELEKKFNETRKEYELYAKIFTEFVLKNVDHIKIE